MRSLPIIFTTQEDSTFIQDLQNRIQSQPFGNVLLEYPTVYIHYWVSNTIRYEDRNGTPHESPRYDVYVGESNNVVGRTRKHYADGEIESNWQYQLLHANSTPQFIVIGHNHFNKSFTLDVENRLIEYIMSAKNLNVIHNGRGNPQNKYFPDEEFKTVFKQIWTKLQVQQHDLFDPESVIFNSALYKASPLKRLSNVQQEAKEQIIARVIASVNNGIGGQLIFVQGEAGTGKTVLATSTFYELIKQIESVKYQHLRCHLVVNHDQQLTVYKQLVTRLDLGRDIVDKPTSFINKHSPTDKVDVCFIDEGHLLLTQGKMSYQGKNQLQDIMDRSRVTVIMFDEYQVLTTEEYWEERVLDYYINLAKSQNNYISLDYQFRMQCSPATADWIKRFVLNNSIERFETDDCYEVKSFDSPEELHHAIKCRSLETGNELSRVVASYDWPYSERNRPETSDTWAVHIGNWSLPWNYELEKRMPQRQKRALKNLAWAEQRQTIDEVGSTFTIQGFDLSYVGVILGPSVKFRDGRIVYCPSESKNEKATRNRTISDGSTHKFGDTFIRNEVKVLMTRGVKGLYIYACDDELRNALKTIAKI